MDSLRILNDLARVDRHRTGHPLTLVVAVARVEVNKEFVSNRVVHTGDVLDGGIVVSLDFHGPGDMTREHIDGDFEFDVDIADVEAVMGPSGEVMRPWGTLARRLRSVHQAVLEYTESMVWIVSHHDELDELDEVPPAPSLS